MKRNLTNATRAKLSNKQHRRLFNIFYSRFLHNTPSDKDYVDTLVKMNYHNDVYVEQEVKGRVLTLPERKRVFSRVKKSFGKTKERMSHRW